MNKTKAIHKPLWRALLAVSALVLLVWSVLPYLKDRILNEGVKATALITIPLLAVCIFWEPLLPSLKKLWGKKAVRILLTIFLATLTLLLTLFVIVSVRMLAAAAEKPSGQATVVVLGAAIRDDGPSSMLKDRLDAAVRYLGDNDRSVCVVSGGQGGDETTAEAYVMYHYLLDKGIDPGRIYIEDRSKNTEENIRYSKELIEKEHLNPQIVIATQEFHQYRAQTIARHEGFADVSPCTCRTKLYLLECYWVREFAAVCRFWLFGY